VSREKDSTVPFEILAVAGNEVFSRAALCLGNAAAPVLRDTVRAMGSTPDQLTLDELGMALPEIERRLRMLMTPDLATRTLARLRRLILDW